MDPVYGLIVDKKSAFFKLSDVYPECGYLIKFSPQITPLQCFQTSCPVGFQCNEKLVHRLNFLFDTFKEVELIFLYFKYPDKIYSIRGGVFWRDFREPAVRTFNRTAWTTLKKRAVIYELHLPEQFFLGPAKPSELIQIDLDK